MMRSKQLLPDWGLGGNGMEEVGLDLGQVDPHGTKQQLPRQESWWLLRSGGKKKQRDAQRQSQNPYRANGLAGKTWNIIS